jgi:hypothetical protein
MQYLKKYILFTVACFLCWTAFSQQAYTSKYMVVTDQGKINYVPDPLGNTIPDFSNVGCFRGRRIMPDVKIVKTITATGDNSEAVIQAAIDELSEMPLDKNGFRGTLLLKKGVYKVPGTIKITAGGIVIRGEGNATKVIATGKGQRNLITVNGSGKLEEIKHTRQKITDHYIPVGAKSFTVDNAAAFKTGDSIVVYRPATQNWISDLKMDQIEVRDSGTKQWTLKEYNFHFERLITKIEGNRIFIDNPVVMAMEDQYGGGEIYKFSYSGRVSNVGIEDLLCESEFSTDTDEDHGWNAIHINRAQNCWVKNVTAIYFGYSCVNLAGESRNITVKDCKSLEAKSKITGGRRYSFNNDGQMNLFENCFASEGRHDFVTGAQVRGPNVFYNCKAGKTHADTGPHHRWAMGTLYDNIVSDGEINAQDRGNWGTGHGWSGVNQVFWNCTASKAAIQDPWVSGKNYVIAMKAAPYPGRLPGRESAEWEPALKGMPPSLYLLQLKQRNH